MKKLPLISLVSFFILIPTITLAEEKDGYEYKSTTTVVSNNYYFFDEPSSESNLKKNLAKPTENYTLFTNFENDWYNADIRKITLNNKCPTRQFDGNEECWTYARFYYIADQISNIGKVVETSNGSGIYSRELYGKNGLNIYHGHSGYKNDLAESTWNLPTKSNECPECTGELDDENIKNINKYWEKICSSITTGNEVSLIYYDEENQNEKPITKNDILNSNTQTFVKIKRTYENYVNPTTIDWNNKMQLSTNNGITSCGGTYPMKDGVHSVVLINAQAQETTKHCIQEEQSASGKCNDSSTGSDLKCLKTIINGNSKAEIKLDQNATITNILTPNEIYQGGGIKLGFIYYNTVKWAFSNETIYGDKNEIRNNIKKMLKNSKTIEDDIKAGTNIFFKDKNGNENEYKIKNIQTSCQQEGNFNEGETVTTICTILLPEAEVELGTGKVNYKNNEGKGINNEYYTPIKYTGNLSLEATIKNIGVLEYVDNWTKNWTLTYDGEKDKTCQVNVNSRLYKPEKNNEYAFIYRPIDLNNPFPNRNAGVNWYDWYSDPYNKNRLKSSYDKIEYTAELDNQIVSKIKEYNKNNNNNYLDWRGISETGKSEFIENNNFMRTYGGGTP